MSRLQPSVAIFLAKQKHILGYEDHRNTMQVGGRIEIVIRDVVGIDDASEPIDITPVSDT